MSWLHEAACTGLDPALFFPERGDKIGVERARAVCAECPVTAECLDYAKRNSLRDGMYGGLSAIERRVKRRHDGQGVACPHCPETFDVPQEIGAHIRHRHPETRTHGTNSSYNHGCRCDECRDAHRIASAEYKRRRRVAV